jgi:hypothetical protein
VNAKEQKRVSLSNALDDELMDTARFIMHKTGFTFENLMTMHELRYFRLLKKAKGEQEVEVLRVEEQKRKLQTKKAKRNG